MPAPACPLHAPSAPACAAWRRALPLLLAGLLTVGGCATHTITNPVTGRTERSAVSEQQLQAQATEAREALIDEHGVVDEPALQGYVDGVGHRLASLSHAPGLAWRFTILDTALVNAFALPGGQVFVTRGLLALLQSEGELAAVLAHEIAHVTARHGARRATGAAVAQAGVAAAVDLGQFLERRGLEGAAQRLERLGQNLAAGLVATYSRDQELEADRIGAEYLVRAGHDLRELVSVLQRLQQVERFQADRSRAPAPTRRSTWLASHPGTERRVREAGRLAAVEHGSGDDSRQRHLRRLEGLVWGDSPEKGLVRERLFVHPRAGFALTAPPGWEFDIDGSAVALHTPDGDATLTVRPLPRVAGRTPAQVIENLLAPSEGRSVPRKVGVFDGTHFVGSRVRDGVRQPLRATVVNGPGRRLVLVTFTARDAAALERRLKALEDAEQTLRATTPADRSAVRVWRLAVVPMPAGGWPALAQPLAALDDAEAVLRLLNGLYGVAAADAQPAPGTLVKTLRDGAP